MPPLASSPREEGGVTTIKLRGFHSGGSPSYLGGFTAGSALMPAEPWRVSWQFLQLSEAEGSSWRTVGATKETLMPIITLVLIVSNVTGAPQCIEPRISIISQQSRTRVLTDSWSRSHRLIWLKYEGSAGLLRCYTTTAEAINRLDLSMKMNYLVKKSSRTKALFCSFSCLQTFALLFAVFVPLLVFVFAYSNNCSIRYKKK